MEICHEKNKDYIIRSSDYINFSSCDYFSNIVKIAGYNDSDRKTFVETGHDPVFFVVCPLHPPLGGLGLRKSNHTYGKSYPCENHANCVIVAK